MIRRGELSMNPPDATGQVAGQVPHWMQVLIGLPFEAYAWVADLLDKGHRVFGWRRAGRGRFRSRCSHLPGAFRASAVLSSPATLLEQEIRRRPASRPGSSTACKVRVHGLAGEQERHLLADAGNDQHRQVAQFRVFPSLRAIMIPSAPRPIITSSSSRS